MTSQWIDAYAQAALAEYRARLETMCEKSLVDPQGRGVAVVGPSHACSMWLDEHVPWGTIFHFPREADYLQWQDRGWPR